MASIDGAALQPRSYQLEMLEEKPFYALLLSYNVILQTRYLIRSGFSLDFSELLNKRVWFLCPSVVLAHQQHRVISSQLPLFQSRLLSGNDGCDRWSTQDIWDSVLMNMNIVVCTFQILLDALIHGFVRMESILLLVFDEAHHCAGNHPANKIMQLFYHPGKARGQYVPWVLGLTASPVTRRKRGDLELIESNLDAISRTPKLTREELLRHVHLPLVRPVLYPETYIQQPPMLHKLIYIFDNLDYSKDPYVIHIKSRPADEISAKDRKVLTQRKTYCQAQMKAFTNMACIMNADLGQWASEHYIYECITRHKTQMENTLIGSDTIEEKEKMYLLRVLSEIDLSISYTSLAESHMLSPKVIVLIDLLVENMRHNFTGIIFVQTRASVDVLSTILSLHPRTKDILAIGTFVGASAHHAKSFGIADLTNTNTQNESLEELRSRKKNLIISTNVCEEGIDIAACNTVICFEAPQNLKSFIQRRGRARSIESRYIIMFPESTDRPVIENFQNLEKEMKMKYMDEMRELREICELEECEDGCKVFEIAASGAKLTLSDAVQHLFHFCNSLPRVQYTRIEPIFLFQEQTAEDVSCKILLPNCVDISIREFSSATTWRTERLARLDAAFEACIGLYHAGLLNDNLMPKKMVDEDADKVYAKMERRPNVVAIDGQTNPWQAIAKAWQSQPQLYRSSISVVFDGREQLHMTAIAPTPLNKVQDFTLFWDAETRAKVQIIPDSTILYDEAQVQVANEVTCLLLYSTFRGRMSGTETGFPVLFVPQEPTTYEWVQQMQATYPANALLLEADHQASVGLIRNSTENGKPYVYHGTENCWESTSEEPESSEPTQLLKVRQLTRRTDFLHPVSLDAAKAPKSFVLLDPARCQVDRLPHVYAQFSLFIPSIMHHIKTSLIVNELCETILAPVCFSDYNLVLTAIFAPVAREAANYQRLEFLGDSILKYQTALTVMAEKLNCPEGYLSSYKDHIVSNKTLAVAAKEVGLDKYILTEPFTGAKWRPLCNADLQVEQSVPERELSTKTLADVVEAIIGAAYLDGGESKTLACLKIFSLNLDWVPFQSCLSTLLSVIPASQTISESFRHLESLIAYSFIHSPLLVEAITHPSYNGKGTPSYQRLEFLGDVVLDRIVTHHIFSHASNLQPFRMHLIRTAAVNAHFLAFLALSLTVSIPVVDVTPVDLTREPETVPSFRQLSLPHFLMHAPNQELTTNLHATFARFETLKDVISSKLMSGSRYPWTELSSLSPEKLVSDLVESTLGAIYVDTSGDLAVCERWLERLGVLPWLRRVLDEGVKVWHPKEELGVCAGNDEVYYETWTEGKDATSAPVSNVGGTEGEMERAVPNMVDSRSDRWRCRVHVGGKDLAVASGRTKTIAEVKAADMAIGLLKGEGNVWTKDEIGDERSCGDNKVATESAILEDTEMKG